MLRRFGAFALGTVLMVGMTATPAWASQPAPPSAPPTVTTGDAHIVVAFAATLDNGGSAIIAYTATCTSGDGGTLGSLANTGSATPITVPADNGKHYACSVTATNSDPSTPTSIPSPNSATILVGVPATPVAPTVTHGNASLKVAFTQPDGSGITNDTATCTDSTPPPVSASQLVSPITVTGLIIGNLYTCHVTATNAVGPGPPSPESTPAVVFAAAPSPPPAAPTVTRGSGTLIVTFGAFAPNGDPISSLNGYAAGCTSTNGVPASATGNASPLTVSGLSTGKSYTCHVHATNGVGTGPDSAESSAVTVALTPGAPSQPTLVSGNGQIIVSFTPGLTNGDPIVNNTASCTSGNGGLSGSASGASPIVVTGLTNSSTYGCSVTSANGIGSGPASPAASIVAGLPAAALQPTVTPGNSQIIVNFAPVSGNGSPITSYTSACISSNGGPLASGSSAAPPVVASTANNSNGFTYTCHVTATNAAGVGPDSPESVLVTPATYPDPPDAPTITPGNNTMQVAFTAPAANGSPITSYTATCVSSDGGVTGTLSGTSSPITVTGLTNSNTYTCNVIAINAQGMSSPSDDSAPAMADAVPAAPTKPTVTSGGARVVVSFILPADNGDAIFKTTATCTSSNGGVTRSAVTQPQDLGETFSPIAVVGLTNGRSYTCKVTATNNVGTSPPSPASAAVIPRSAPSAPIGVRAVSGNATGSLGAVNVAFTPGSGNGSPITSFRATCTDLSTSLKVARTGAGSPIAVGGLTTGHTFSCVAYDTGPGGTSAASAAVQVVLGAPGIPVVVRVVEKNHALTLSLLAPSGNGKPVTRYAAVCTSTNGGAKRGSASGIAQLVVTNLSLGASYTCTVTASNARGVGGAAKVGPINITQ